MASRSWSALGNETWLTRLFVAAMYTPVEGGTIHAGGVDEAVQLAILKCPVDVSVSFRGSRRRNRSRQERFRAAWSRPTRCGRRSWAPLPLDVKSHLDFASWPSRVAFARWKRMASARTNSLLARFSDGALDLRDADHRGLGETHERIHQD